MGYSATQNGIWTTWSPTLTGFSTNPIFTARYMLIGKTCYVDFTTTTVGVSNATTKTITLPFAAADTAIQFFMAQGQNNGTEATRDGYTRVNSNVADMYPAGSLGTWTASGNASFTFNMFYEIA